ncbi:MAG: hypothetical protein WCE38_25040 [Burkholderiales bacterium]
MSDNDREIEIVESRIEAERDSLAEGVRQLGATVRDALVSPQALLATAATGYLLGEALRPFRRPTSNRKQAPSGMLAAAVLSLVRAHYGSLAQLAQTWAWREAMRAWQKSGARRAGHRLAGRDRKPTSR